MNDDVTATTLERFRVREVLERYSDGITRQDCDAVAAVHAKDAKFEELAPLTLKFRGRKEIVENVRYAVERMHPIVFMLHSRVVELDGDRARSKSSSTNTASSIKRKTRASKYSASMTMNW